VAQPAGIPLIFEKSPQVLEGVHPMPNVYRLGIGCTPSMAFIFILNIKLKKSPLNFENPPPPFWY